jgi:hypothetical protein
MLIIRQEQTDALAARTPDGEAVQPCPLESNTWIEIEMVGEDGSPVAGEPFKITLPDGGVIEGTLDGKGFARVDGIDPGTCQVTFPRLDTEAWERS